MFEKRVMEMIYGKAATPEDLPWHNPEPYDFLREAADANDNSGRALDLGCGTGVISVELAKRGFEVTAVDFIPKAIEMAMKRAKEEDVNIDFVAADLLKWTSDEPFDLVHDSGTLHSIPTSSIPIYKQQLLGWSEGGTDLVLAHWGKKGPFDWRPIGPNRRTRKKLVSFFGPEFEEKDYSSELMENIPLPFGPSVVGQSFWFVRK
ncbi:MAG: class I SAM-dependent methyltransferase [Pyrinomonadaceae bacterium]|nr:class I SAM-dependent methyltransferase [Pyrinomonadaceae bacterium]